MHPTKYFCMSVSCTVYAMYKSHPAMFYLLIDAVGVTESQCIHDPQLNIIFSVV